MLYEVCANLAVVKALPQTADGEVRVGKDGSISFLNDELIEEGEAAREGALISIDLFYLQRGGNAFEIDASGVTGRV